MKTITACSMDCPDACSLLIQTDRGGCSVKGNPDHPVTAGLTCAKIKKHIRRLKHPDRVIFPMRRVGDSWEQISWDAALDLCAEKIQGLRSAPSAILHIMGSGAKGVLKEASQLFFDRLGASRVRGSLCDATGIMSYIYGFGSRKNHDLDDLLQAARIVNWGKDFSRSSIHTAAVVRKARRQGTKVLSISPGGDGNGSFSDHQICIRPGTDRFLVAAVLQRFLETGRIDPDILEHTRKWETFRSILENRSSASLAAACDVTASDIDTVFSWYADTGPIATFIGAGLQRYSHGGETVRFINSLALVSGNIGRSGGGSYFHLHAYRNLNLEWIKDPERKKRRSFKLPIIGREILSAKNPPVRMIWVNGANIVNQAAGSKETIEAFEKTDFVVVADAFMTDTAEKADLFLPASLMLEQEDIIGSYLHDYVQYLQPVLDRPETVRDDYEILCALGKRLEPVVEMPEKDRCFENALDSPVLDISLDPLKKRKWVRADRPLIPYEGLRFDHFDGSYRFPTHLHDESSAPEGFPLRLLTLVRRGAMHSQMMAEDQAGLPTVWAAPTSGVWEHVDPGKDIFLISPEGRLKVCIKALPGLHPDAVVYRRGDWIKFGGGANQLIEARLTDMGIGAAFYDQYVRLENG
jgi:anaerobic selenocysteine-containing dehydrogenase